MVRVEAETKLAARTNSGISPKNEPQDRPSEPNCLVSEKFILVLPLSPFLCPIPSFFIAMDAAADAAEASAATLAALPPPLQQLLDEGLSTVPPSYIRPFSDRPHHLPRSSAQIPLIDISGLLSPLRRPLILHHLRDACAHWGFFQVTNHGVRRVVVDEMRAACRRFFQQPSEWKNVYRSQSFEDPLAYSTSFNPSKEKSNDWKDVLYVRDFPGNHINGFDIVPEICRRAFQEFKKEVEILAKQLYTAIFESLGVSSSYINGSLPGIPWLAMCVNYYPRCPDPSVTYGSTAHTDGGSLTVLLQDDVPGLWIQSKYGWVQVKPISDSFVINIGDQIEILSNGIYKSIKHTVITDSEMSRISVACIFGPKEDEKIAPIEELVNEDEPAIYKSVTFNHYLYNVYNLELLKSVPL